MGEEAGEKTGEEVAEEVGEEAAEEVGEEALSAYLRKKFSSILREGKADSSSQVARLRRKFSSILREAGADSSSPSQIISSFKNIEILINSICQKSISSSSTASPSLVRVDLLYEHIDDLWEYRIRTHQRQKTAAAKKGFFRFMKVDLLTDFFLRQNMKKRLVDRKKELDEIEGKLQTTPRTPAAEAGLALLPTHPIVDTSQFIGLETYLEEIVDLIMAKTSAFSSHREEEEAAKGYLTAIAIVGRYGCGKTTLARMVLTHPKIREVFSPRIWLCLSNKGKGLDPGLGGSISILEKILERHYSCEDDSDDDHDHDRDNDDFGVTKPKEKVRGELMGKRYLIVMDDVWEVDEWSAVLRSGKLFSNGLPKASGSAIIVTSRLPENVIRTMVKDEEHVIRMKRLSDEICWQIFSNAVKEKGKMDLDDHPKRSQIKDEVIRYCDGLPLIAKTFANIFSPDLLKPE